MLLVWWSTDPKFRAVGCVLGEEKRQEREIRHGRGKSKLKDKKSPEK